MLKKRGAKNKIKKHIITQRLHEITLLFSAGIPLLQTLQMISETAQTGVEKNLFNRIRLSIEAGLSLSEAFSYFPAQFDAVTCALITAGETSGALDVILKRLVSSREKNHQFHLKIKRALFYPILLLITAGLTLLFMLTFVIPAFANLFADLGGQLPLLTQFFIDSAGFTLHGGWIVCPLLIIGFFAFNRLKKYSPRYLAWEDHLQLNCPLFGALYQKTILQGFCQNLSTILSAGIPLSKALSLITETLSSNTFKINLRQAYNTLQQGNAFHETLRKTQLFSDQIIQMVAIGEEAGKLDNMLERIAEIREQEIEQSLELLGQILEPLIIGFLGLVVGSIVLAMYLPIVKLGMVV